MREIQLDFIIDKLYEEEVLITHKSISENLIDNDEILIGSDIYRNLQSIFNNENPCWLSIHDRNSYIKLYSQLIARREETFPVWQPRCILYNNEEDKINTIEYILRRIENIQFSGSVNSFYLKLRCFMSLILRSTNLPFGGLIKNSNSNFKYDFKIDIVQIENDEFQVNCRVRAILPQKEIIDFSFFALTHYKMFEKMNKLSNIIPTHIIIIKNTTKNQLFDFVKRSFEIINVNNYSELLLELAVISDVMDVDSLVKSNLNGKNLFKVKTCLKRKN